MASTIDLIIIKAKFRLLSTNEGGRKSGIWKGYRPNHVFEYKEGKILRTYIGDIVFDDFSTIEPGEEKIVSVRFISAEELKLYLVKGRKWFIHEGPILVGEAEVL